VYNPEFENTFRNQGKMFLEKRAKPAISHMRDSGMTSALGL
jgi:hypothetical protein